MPTFASTPPPPRGFIKLTGSKADGLGTHGDRRMKNTMLAILAAALAALAPFALAAEGQGDNNAGKQPTLAELRNRIAALDAKLGTLATANAVNALATTVGTLATTVGTLSSTVSANHTTIVGKFAPQMAVVMTVPTATHGAYNATYHLVGESTIPGFPAGTVGTTGQFTDRTLPAGTYLFELQQPYGDNAICQRSVSVNGRTVNVGQRRNAVCPRAFMAFQSGRGTPRLNDGFGVYTATAPTAFFVAHRFPTGLAFTDDKPMSSYSAAVRITKLK